MHAVVVHVTVNDRNVAIENLRGRLVPTISGLPGFVAGYWVALSGSNTSTNALFGGFQYAVGGLLRMPLLLLPSLNSAGAEVGKPVAPQTTSVGV